MFRALVLEKEPDFRAAVREVDDGFLPEGDVTVAVDYSTLNYKDALAITNRVARGAQLAHGGRHRRRRQRAGKCAPGWKPGDAVVLNGFGVGETHRGCLARPGAPEGQWLVRRPAGLQRPPGHGDRHGGLHRHAVRAGAGAPRPARRRWRSAGDRRHRRRRLAWPWRCWRSWGTRWWPRPARLRRPITCSALGAAA